MNDPLSSHADDGGFEVVENKVYLRMQHDMTK